jgi:hypothetical protein
MTNQQVLIVVVLCVCLSVLAGGAAFFLAAESASESTATTAAPAPATPAAPETSPAPESSAAGPPAEALAPAPAAETPAAPKDHLFDSGFTVAVKVSRNFLHVAGLDLYDAKGGRIRPTASQVKTSKGPSSAQLKGWGMGLALGRTSSLFDEKDSTMWHSGGTGEEFIEVRVPAKRGLSKIVITNRKDCCKERLVGATLSVTSGGVPSVSADVRLDTQRDVYGYRVESKGPFVTLTPL